MFSFRCSNVARKFYICKYFLHLFSEIGENCENCVIGIAEGGGVCYIWDIYSFKI